MHARLLRPGFFTNEELGELPPMARLLFAGLWCLADREGRLEERPKRIKAELFAYDSVNVAALLDQLVEKGFIQRYEVEGKHFINIPSFLCHQHPHQREAPSSLPPYLGQAGGTPKACQGHAESSPKAMQRPAVTIPVPVTVIESVPVPEGVLGGEPSAGAAGGGGDDFGQICTLYEENIGPLKAAVKDRLVELSYEDSVTPLWFEAAVKEALKHNALDPLAYVEAVLKRWESEGFKSGVPPGRQKQHGQVLHGTPRGQSLAGPSGICRTEEDVKAVLAQRKAGTERGRP